jgi:hypothetical protein
VHLWDMRSRIRILVLLLAIAAELVQIGFIWRDR